MSNLILCLDFFMELAGKRADGNQSALKSYLIEATAWSANPSSLVVLITDPLSTILT